jgi:Fe-S-cluster containining protein
VAESRLKVTVRVSGRSVKVAHSAPGGPARPDELLPFMYAVDDAVIGVGVGQQKAQGRQVSCRKGCDACCRAQPVPVTPAETLALTRMVQSLAEPAQQRVRARFAAGAERLREAGLFATLVRDDPTIDPEHARATIEAYIRLGLACPFLEDGACSIHARRPFVCRQYLVTSPPSLCADPLTAPVAVVPLPLKPVGSMLKVSGAVVGRPQLTVPLMLALVYAERHRDELQRTADARQVLQAWLDGL